MGIKKFISNAIFYLDTKNYALSNKKKSLNNLLERLNTRKLNLTQTINQERDETNIFKLREELNIISLYIDKSNNALNKLNTTN